MTDNEFGPVDLTGVKLDKLPRREVMDDTRPFPIQHGESYRDLDGRMISPRPSTVP